MSATFSPHFLLANTLGRPQSNRPCQWNLINKSGSLQEPGGHFCDLLRNGIHEMTSGNYPHGLVSTGHYPGCNPISRIHCSLQFAICSSFRVLNFKLSNLDF